MLSEKAKAFSVASLLRKRPLEENCQTNQPHCSKYQKINESSPIIPDKVKLDDYFYKEETSSHYSSLQNATSKSPPPEKTEFRISLRSDLVLTNPALHSVVQEEQGVPSTTSGITCYLLNADLWNEFHQHQTEMIITKTGRRMFPVIKVRVVGLNPDALYKTSLTVKAKDSKRYRYSYAKSQWIVCGSGDPIEQEQQFDHPDSPLTGRQWMEAQAISFDKLKLTNCKATDNLGQIFLHSMQKYIPEIKFETISPSSEVTSNFTFNETSFITVTAYQNQSITKLKINSNPFAKGFRDNVRTRSVISPLNLMTNSKIDYPRNFFVMSPPLCQRFLRPIPPPPMPHFSFIPANNLQLVAPRAATPHRLIYARECYERPPGIRLSHSNQMFNPS